LKVASSERKFEFLSCFFTDALVKNHINYIPAPAETLADTAARIAGECQAKAEQPPIDNDHVAAGCDTFDSPMEAALAAVSEAKPQPGNDNDDGEVFTA